MPSTLVRVWYIVHGPIPQVVGADKVRIGKGTTSRIQIAITYRRYTEKLLMEILNVDIWNGNAREWLWLSTVTDWTGQPISKLDMNIVLFPQHRTP